MNFRITKASFLSSTTRRQHNNIVYSHWLVILYLCGTYLACQTFIFQVHTPQNTVFSLPTHPITFTIPFSPRHIQVKNLFKLPVAVSFLGHYRDQEFI